MLTTFGTVLCLWYDLEARIVIDVKVSTYIKSMVEFKLVKAKAASEGLDLCMLIEHDCLCQIRFYEEEPYHDPYNLKATLLNE